MMNFRSVRSLAVLLLLSIFLLIPVALAAGSDDAVEMDSYIVQLVDAPLARYAGGVSGYPATAPSLTGARRLQGSDPAVAGYRGYLSGRQEEALSSFQRVLGRRVQVEQRYDAVLNGFALRLSAAEAARLAAQPEVIRVERETVRFLMGDQSALQISAPTIWDGSDGDLATEGEGIVIGVIDTGLNLDHPSFADVGGDGYDHQNPWGAGNYVGLCVADPSLCSDKVIGLWNYADGPEDTSGHGSHTASSAAGNHLFNVTYSGIYTDVVFPHMSGIAPHANLVIYDACTTSCRSSRLVAALNQAVLDGVDVINYSIGGGTTSPWLDSEAYAMLSAREAGIFIAAAAGNDGPGAGTVVSPGNAPWVMAVGGAWHDRRLVETPAESYITINPANGDYLRSWTARGPNTGAMDTLKPDLVMPGSKILGAVNTITPGSNPEFAISSGSSMASPQAAGAAALLRARHPEWTPGQIHSALMTTAHEGILDDDNLTPATPFDMGAGRVDLSLAARAGLLLDVVPGTFWDANPATGGSPRDLNLPSMTDSQCSQQCVWSRTVTSGMDETVSWLVSAGSVDGIAIEVSPATFDLAPGGSQTLVITAAVGGLPAGQWAFGALRLTPADPGSLSVVPADAHLPVAVQPQIAPLPAEIVIDTRRDAGSHLVEDLTAAEITNLRVDIFGLTPAVVTASALVSDPTADPYDDPGGAGSALLLHNVPAGSPRFVAEIVASESADVALFVGRDENGNGQAEAGEALCAAQESGWLQRCVLESPAPGSYWILVQNVEGSLSPRQIESAVVAVDPAASTNLTVEGPETVAHGMPFDLQIFWDEPLLTEGDHWYGLVELGSDAASPASIGRLPIVLHRQADGVAASVDAEIAYPTDQLSYNLLVRANVTAMTETLYLTHTLPTHMTYVQGSAASSLGQVEVQGNQLTWSGALPPGAGTEVSIDFEGYVNSDAPPGASDSITDHRTSNPGSVVESVISTVVIQPPPLFAGESDMELMVRVGTDPDQCSDNDRLLLNEPGEVTVCYLLINRGDTVLDSHELRDAAGALLWFDPAPLMPLDSRLVRRTLYVEESLIASATWRAVDEDQFPIAVTSEGTITIGTPTAISLDRFETGSPALPTAPLLAVALFGTLLAITGMRRRLFI